MTPFGQTSARTTTIRHHTETNPATTAHNARLQINVHLLGHSTGAYVIREAFLDAEQHASIASVNWTVS